MASRESRRGMLAAIVSIIGGAIGLVGFGTAALAGGPYTFIGLEWGSSPEQVSKVLRARGFKVSKPRTGPATEYVRMNAWLDIRSVDRGKRIKAFGAYLGETVEVDLVFGFNDRLERINLRTPSWDGTTKGAKRMTKVGDKLVAYLESKFGTAIKKIRHFGFTDTARWQRASDGSNMEMFIRGAKGFMFFPKYKTSMNVNFWNTKYESALPAMASKDGKTRTYLVGD